MEYLIYKIIENLFIFSQFFVWVDIGVCFNFGYFYLRSNSDFYIIFLFINT